MKKKLVAYFSCSGNTAKAAKTLAETLNADTYEIRPQIPYTPADLNWQDKQSRSSVEMQNKASRPPLADTDAPVATHDIIFLGFPIWWYVAPTIINTFLEAYDFNDKTIILFATSGGSGFGKALDGLRSSAPGASLHEGRVFTGGFNKAALVQWATGLNI